MKPTSASKLEKVLQKKYSGIEPHLNEHSRRIWAASEAISLGHGGKKLIHAVTGLSYTTIHAGQVELEEAEKNKLVETRIRKKGGGRKKKILSDEKLQSDIQNIVESSTRGDPETPLLWCSKSTRKIANDLNKNQDKKRISHTLVWGIAE